LDEQKNWQSFESKLDEFEDLKIDTLLFG